ncbi:winged helix-turn-helix domain-containing protein [Rhodanobacter lindaniclasticus]
MERDTALPGLLDPDGRTGRARVRVGECLVEADLNHITAPHGEAALEPKAMAVLVYLIEHAGAVVSTGELIDAVWRGRPMGDNPVYRCIAQLRRALGDDPREPRYITTVPTKGYRLIAPVEVPGAERRAPPVVPDRRHEPAPAAPASDAPMPTRSPWRPWLRPTLLLLMLCVVALAAWVRHRAPDASVASVAAPVPIAVLPLQAAAHDEAGTALAQSATDVIRHGLARLPGLVVVADTSAAHVPGAAGEARAIGRQLHARYLLRGDVVGVDGRLRVRVQLLDGRSGKLLWSSAPTRPMGELALLRDDIVRGVADVLRQPVATHDTGAIHLDAFAVYLRGQRLLSAAPSDADEAVELFRRATILDPGFARAYQGLGLALVQKAEAAPGPAAGTQAEAAQAFDRALELDPALGEAWVGRALLESEPARAEALFRKGLALAPSDGPGHVRHAQFLFAHARVGEAIEAMERARRIDPLAPELCLTQAFFVMVVRSDVAEHDRLVSQALEINPRLPAALYQLAWSKWEYSGEFAQAARLIEQAIRVEPQSLPARALARNIYLDLGDPAAALAVLGPDPAPLAGMELAQYRGDRKGAAAALAMLTPASWPDGGPQAAKAQAIRDAAIEAGDPAAAVRVLQPVYTFRTGRLPMLSRGFALAYAHTLVLAGDVRGGQTLARETLALVDAHGIGRARHWFSRERAAAFAVLGDDAQVLQELAHSVENGQLYRWWYLAGHDPLYAHLRGDPRFQALDRQATAHRDRQRTLHEAMQREDGVAAARLTEQGETGSVPEIR